MKDHISYLKYVLRHKFFVLMACRLTGASLWRGFVHDLSKFRPSEWIPYTHTFYAKDGSKRYKPTLDFDLAWNAHQKRNPHHHQYWTILRDDSTIETLPMFEVYVREMIADWVGAGIAITGYNEVHKWYEKNKDKMRLHPDTRELVEKVLEEIR